MSKQLDEAKALLRAMAEEIDTLAEIEEPTEEQDTRFSELTTGGEYERAQERVKALEAREERAAQILEASRVVLATEPVDRDTRAKTVKRDPFDFSTLPLVRPGESPAAEYRSRAHDALEQAPEYVTHEHRESAARLIDNDQRGEVAEHCLTVGGPKYTEAFFNYLRTGQLRMNDGTEYRTAMSTTAGNGGHLIPFHLDPTIILTNNGSTNPFRRISRVESITTNVWHGVSSAGVTAEWIAEATQVADGSPTTSQPSITPQKADAYIQASFEVVQDSNIGSQIGMLFADAKDNLEASAFATGTGSGQPYGVSYRLTNTTASRVDANTNQVFGLADVYSLVNNLPARHQDNASWLGHWSTFNLIRRMGEGSVGAAAFWTDLGPGIPPQLLGKSVYTSSAMDSTIGTATASNDDILVLGDFSKYCIVDRIGMEVVYNPLVLSTNANRPTGEVAWVAFWRVGADCLDTNAFRQLRV